MKKIFKIFLKITLLSATTAILTIITIVLFPQRLFAFKMKYNHFTVYSDDKIDENLEIILNNAMSLIKKSEIYDSNYNFNVILCYNSYYNKIDDKLLGIGPAARTTLNNVIVKVKIDPKNNLAFPNFHKACEVNLTELLAHEMTHCLQANKYGIFKFNPFKHPELWKLEGYPEYISKQKKLSNKNYRLTCDIDRYIYLKSITNDIWISEEDGGCEVPDYYYKGMLMTEYLMDIRHFSYNEILNDTASENTVYREMIQWKDSTDKSIN